MGKNATVSERKIEDIMAMLLILGVVLAAATAIAGGGIFLFRHGLEPASYHVFRGEPADLRSVVGILSQSLAGRGRGIIQLGLLFLILTPIARVLFAVYAFFKEKDLLYVVVNLVVFGFLMFSLIGGIAIK
jgi:uncharacterized membrane protein